MNNDTDCFNLIDFVKIMNKTIGIGNISIRS